jgi:hypothetical protein
MTDLSITQIFTAPQTQMAPKCAPPQSDRTLQSSAANTHHKLHSAGPIDSPTRDAVASNLTLRPKAQKGPMMAHAWPVSQGTRDGDTDDEQSTFDGGTCKEDYIKEEDYVKEENYSKEARAMAQESNVVEDVPKKSDDAKPVVSSRLI